MDFELEATTPVGRRFVELTEGQGPSIDAEAAVHDIEGTFPADVFKGLARSGLLRAPLPTDFGGLGLDSVHDLMVGVSRLGRADGSIAIAAQMHLAFAYIAARRRRGAREMGDEEAPAGAEGFLGLLGAGSLAMANATEPATDIRHPMTELTKADGGWAVNGRKSFGTLSELADIFFVTARRVDPDGSANMAYAFVPRGTPGQTILDNWDGLGMRASGSHDVVYDNCIVPDELVLRGGPWGLDDDLSLLVATAGTLGLCGAFLGIAEAAHAVTIETARTRIKSPDGRPIAHRTGVQRAIAEMEADLVVCRAILERTAHLLDDYLCRRGVPEVSLSTMHSLNREVQCTKLVANRAAINIVDSALTVSGGSGYLRTSRLARLYRDVRAGPFMQPLSPLEAYEYVGRIALGLDPAASGP